MKIIFVSLGLTVCSFAEANESSKFQLPQSGAMILAEESTRYELKWERLDGSSVLVYSHEVAKKGNPHRDWFTLLAIDESDQSILALVELNVVSLMFINYDKDEKVVKSERFVAPGLELEKGLSLAPPNRIAINSSGQSAQSWSVIQGRLIDENGEVYGSSRFAKVVNGKIVLNDAPKLTDGGDEKLPDEAPPSSLDKEDPTSIVPSEEPASSIPWAVVTAAIAGAFGLLWFLLNRRKR